MLYSSNKKSFSFPMHGSVNVTEGEEQERMMNSGLHTVVDIFCVGCGSIVGWKYVRTLENLPLPLLFPV